MTFYRIKQLLYFIMLKLNLYLI